jgi:GWxTD domain-containing protein
MAQNTVRTLEEFWFDDDDWHHDVQYIISAEELSEFRQLRNTQERDSFISQFWAQRDPSPGTPQNEFRDEFYRRLKYANAHFADPANPSHDGMETDRGLFYVMYGAPDNIEQYPAGAYEIWRYAAPRGTGSAFRIEFSVPPIE